MINFLFDTPALALVLTAAVYLRCLNNEFVYDDKDMITHNRFIGDWAMVWKSFVNDSWWFLNPLNLPQSAYYRPLQDVWLWLNYHLFGFALPGWHLALIAVHLVVVWLVFEVARNLIAHRWTPLLAATLFGLMPVHAQAVVWPIAIPLPMSAAFELAAFLCFIRGGRAGGGRRLWALAFYALALLSHESAVVFPLLLVAFAVILEPERFSQPPIESVRESIRPALVRAAVETWPFFAVLAGYLAVRLAVLGFVARRHIANPMTFAQVLMTIPSALAMYLRLLVVPWSAGPDHQVEAVSSMLSRDFYLPLALLAAVAIAAVLVLWKSPRRRLYLFCSFWIAIGLAPVLNLQEFPPLVMVQDRYLYMSSVAWCVMVADIVVALFERARLGAAALAAGGAVLAAVFAGFLFQTEGFWHDDVTLFSTCLQMFPNSWECHVHLGTALFDRRDLVGAEREFRTTLEINPNYPGALLNLAMVNGQTGRTAEALDDMRRALVLMPQWVHAPTLYINLARDADMVGAVELRDSALEAAARLPGGPAAVELGRAQIAIKHGDFATAETLMRSASARNPDDAETWALLAATLEREGKTPQAIEACRKALALKPDENLTRALEKMLLRLGAA